jgi:hypothetical protein
MDGNQLAKISFAGEHKKNYIPATKNYGKRCLQVAKEHSIEIKIEIQGFHRSCYANEIKILQLNWTDATMNFIRKTLHFLPDQNSFHISQNRLI